jgi:ABC-type transport system involved in multi-copper enzyme maturation permease subunit
LRRIKIVFYRDFRELRKTNAFLIISILFTVITVAASIIIVIALRKQELLGKEIARPMLELIISLIAYFLPLSVLMTFIWAFTFLTIIQEKVKGNIESLLATPLTPKEIWIGKSMAIFLPGYIISIISTLFILLAVNFIVIIPATGSFILPAPLLLTSFLISPLFFLALLLFIVLFSLANNPDIAIAPSFLIGFGLMIGIPLGIATGAINLVSWSFTLWCLGGAIILWAADFGFYRLLTKESIVLSSKGD